MNIKLKVIILAMLSFLLLGGLVLETLPVFASEEPKSVISDVLPSKTSHNWAGYVAVNGTYTSVSGSWVVPKVASSSGLSGDAVWVGIGGVSGRDLIQTGTQATTNASGRIQYTAWYETLPGNSIPVSVAVSPGDSITASVAKLEGNQWSVSLRNNTNGQSFQKTVAYSSSLSSAEWIEEMVSSSRGGFIPLDNFGAVQFSNASTTKNGISMSMIQAGAQKMSMVNGVGQVLAAPSEAASDGASFSVERTSASVTPQVSYAFGRRSFYRIGNNENGFIISRRGNGFSISFGFGGRGYAINSYTDRGG